MFNSARAPSDWSIGKLMRRQTYMQMIERCHPVCLIDAGLIDELLHPASFSCACGCLHTLLHTVHETCRPSRRQAPIGCCAVYHITAACRCLRTAQPQAAPRSLLWAAAPEALLLRSQLTRCLLPAPPAQPQLLLHPEPLLQLALRQLLPQQRPAQQLPAGCHLAAPLILADPPAAAPGRLPPLPPPAPPPLAAAQQAAAVRLRPPQLALPPAPLQQGPLLLLGLQPPH